VPYGTDSQLDVFQAMNCLATIIESLRDRILERLNYVFSAQPAPLQYLRLHPNGYLDTRLRPH